MDIFSPNFSCYPDVADEHVTLSPRIKQPFRKVSPCLHSRDPTSISVIYLSIPILLPLAPGVNWSSISVEVTEVTLVGALTPNTSWASATGEQIRLSTDIPPCVLEGLNPCFITLGSKQYDLFVAHYMYTGVWLLSVMHDLYIMGHLIERKKCSSLKRFC